MIDNAAATERIAQKFVGGTVSVGDKFSVAETLHEAFGVFAEDLEEEDPLRFTVTAEVDIGIDEKGQLYYLITFLNAEVP